MLNTLRFSLVSIFFMFIYPAQAETVGGKECYIGAVATDSTHRYLQIARISGVGSVPSVVQNQWDLSSQFSSVLDAAFLTNSTGGDRRIAVLGNCLDYVAGEYFDWYRWRGYTHHLRGKVIIYNVSTSGLLTAVTDRTIEFEQDFIPWPTASTVAYTDRGGQNGETWRITGLSSGGFAINASAVRDPGPGWQPDRYNPYNQLLVWDKTYTFKFQSGMQIGYSDGQMFDAAGLADLNGPDRVVSTWAGVAGGQGNIHRWLINWDSGSLVNESSAIGGNPWCYYMNRVEPLAEVVGNVVSGGAVIRSNTLASVNIAADFSTGFLDEADGWGRCTPNGVLDTMGVCSDLNGGDIYAVLRTAGDVYKLFLISPTGGDYTYENFSFTWTGNPSTIVASAGDALAGATLILGDLDRDGKVHLSDFVILAAQWLSTPGSPSADIAEPLDNFVDAADLAVFCNNWLTNR
jgi:hypothetical protein